MKKKVKPVSKIPTTGTNTNKKKKADSNAASKSNDTSLFKKNEFALILIGALLLTTIIFFLFFRSSKETTPSDKPVTTNSSFSELENRMEKMEQTTLLKNEQGTIVLDPKSKDVPSIALIDERLSRLEAAFSLKFDSMVERMEKLEKKISIAQSKPVVKATPKSVQKAKKTIPEKKAVKKAVKKTDLFHTVVKGETLYSISKKYKTSVDSLRKLNNFSENTKLYPGNNILVR
jgi:LysM repeat protein